ncbi:class 1 fructose-bisphosphatase [Mesorhizobium sp. AA23]|uniref:class 1 fructose-bisphosphatase n=1 Tax=Mesorhizobium sp. AA23 TaxID=1854058 RepID=UPI0007FF71E8|nr:class 1 fructose-bisphosphatase [Mesorhizobium sp. AA23]OBQ92516.1 fructose-bisphosphatase [Mesorhizobium sp. AA23]
MNVLRLANDQPARAKQAVEDYLEDWAGPDMLRLAIAKQIDAIVNAARALSARIALGEIPGNPAEIVGVNSDSDKQKAIDVASHHLFLGLLREAGAAQVLSEEAEAPAIFAESGLAIAIDPLDGSGNVGLGASLGTLFSIAAFNQGEDPFLKPGSELLAAGYVSYGNTVDLGFSVGDGVVLSTLNSSDGSFYVTRENVRIKPDTADLAYNASLHRHLLPSTRSYVDDCLRGSTGPRGRDFNMRWLGAAVGELHRILLRGGVFLYVADTRPGYEQGRLRHVYEANPIAYLMRAAGGLATDGRVDILEKTPLSHHCRTPLVFGSANEVEVISGLVRNA